jgi:hypothetical protein
LALQIIPLGDQLRIRVQVGQDSQGNPIFRFRTINNIKPTASDQDVYDVANALANLQKHAVEGIYRERDVKYENV